MNLIKKFKNLLYYRDVLKQNKQLLYEKYNVKVDMIYRMYTVYSIDPKEYDQYGGIPDKVEKTGNESLESFLNNHINTGKVVTGEKYFEAKVNNELYRLEQFLISKGLVELFGLTERKRLDRYNVKCVVEYKYLNTQFLANMMVIFGSVTLFSIILGFFLLLIKLFIV